jgi:4-amino-4-deoxy-L-arabinose transferase-like glycosyltransferase
VADLRQLINVLPMLAAVLLLVYTWTRFKSVWRALGLFVLLLAVPAVVDNNLWWHPDSLGMLFVALVFFFLDRDNLRFGRNFILAAAFCGVAVGTKYLGVFFVFAIPLYLVWGSLTHKIHWKRSLGLGALFVGVMAAAVVVSNPLLLLPQERAELISTQVWQFQQTTVGIIMKVTEPYFSLSAYPQDFRIHYGELMFVL